MDGESISAHLKQYYDSLCIIRGEVILAMGNNYNTIDEFSVLDEKQEIMLDSIVPMVSIADKVRAA